MTRPLKRQLALAGLVIAGVSGWIVAWLMWQERDELESKRQHRTVRTTMSPQPSKPAPPRADTGAGLVKLIKDKRSAAFIDELFDIVSAAQPGVRNERYIQAARGVLLDNNWERRTRNFSLLLENLRPEDAPAIQEAFVALGKEGRPYEEYRYFATRWGEVDGKGAMEYFKAQPELKISQWDMRQVIKGWGQAAPQEALSWFAENAEFAEKFQPANAVLQGWSREDPDAATAWLLANSSSPAMTAGSLSEIMLEQLYGKGIVHAGEWLAALPDTEAVNPAKHMAWMSIQGRFRQLGSEDAAAVWRSVGSESWMGWQDFEGFAANVAAANGGDTVFLNAVAGADSAGHISNQFERWAAAEPERTSGWLTQHSEDSLFRTAAIKGMLRYLDKTDPEAAAAWRQQLPE